MKVVQKRFSVHFSSTLYTRFYKKNIFPLPIINDNKNKSYLSIAVKFSFGINMIMNLSTFRSSDFNLLLDDHSFNIDIYKLYLKDEK